MSPMISDTAAIRRRCIGCGKCRLVCPVFENDLFDPMEFMLTEEGDVTQCIGGGKCSKACRRSDPFTVIRMAKGE